MDLGLEPRRPHFLMGSYRRQMVLLEEMALRLEHGGTKSLGRRKEARPIATRRAMHVTMRATLARGAMSFLLPHHARRIESLCRQLGNRFGVKIYELGNSGNHLHLLLKARTREGFKNFLRSFTGKVALTVTGARKGKPFGRFFDALTHSRIVEWGRAYFHAKRYVVINRLEGLGLIPHQARGGKNLSQRRKESLYDPAAPL